MMLLPPIDATWVALSWIELQFVCIHFCDCNDLENIFYEIIAFPFSFIISTFQANYDKNITQKIISQWKKTTVGC